jgi:hypothetical protein
MSLSDAFRTWKRDAMTPNLRVGGGPSPMVTITMFVATMVKQGSAVELYTERDWTKVLADEGITDPDDVVNALEAIGTWSGHLGLPA